MPAPVKGEPAFGPPTNSRAPSAGQPTQDVDRDQHAVDRDTGAHRRLGTAPRPRRSIVPTPSFAAAPSTSTATTTTTSAAYGNQPIDRPRVSGAIRPPRLVDESGAPTIVDPLGEVQREPRPDAEGRQGRDERVRQSALDQDDPVDRRRREPGQDVAPIAWTVTGVSEDHGADDAAERDVRADREVDAPRQDDQQLAERDHADTGRLLQDVADVPEGQEHMIFGRDPQDDDEQAEDEQRPALESSRTLRMSRESPPAGSAVTGSTAPASVSASAAAGLRFSPTAGQSETSVDPAFSPPHLLREFLAESHIGSTV